MSYRTHSIFPDSQKNTYGNGSVENITFTIVLNDGDVYVPNTLRLTGEVNFFKQGNTPFDATDLINYDNKTGAHSLFRSMYVSDDMGTSSSINEYPSWVRHLMLRKYDLQDYCGNSTLELALALPTLQNTAKLINKGLLPFSIYPQVSLNLIDPTSGGVSNKRGNIQFMVSTNNTLSILSGDVSEDQGVNVNPLTTAASYSITNLKLSYDTRQALPVDNQCVMMTVYHAKHTASSSADTFNLNLPVVASSIVLSYKPVSNVNSASVPEYVFVNPRIERLEINYNNSTNEIISFPLKNDQEILVNSLNALELSNRTNSTVFDCLSASADQFTVGVSFGEPLDLKKAKLSIRTESNNITNGVPHFMDLFAVGSMVLTN